MKINLRKKIFPSSKKQPILIQYNPPEGLDSAEVGLLLYRRSDPLSIISLIYKWIGAGLISVDKEDSKNGKKTHFIMHKIKEIPEITPPYELLFWKSFFDSGNDIKIDSGSDLDLKESLKSLEERGYKKGWFDKKSFMDEPEVVVMCIIMILMALLWIIPNNAESEKYMSLSLIVLFMIFYFFPKIGVIVGIEIPKFKKLKITQKGKNLVSHIIGYREFLRNCDAEVLKIFLKQDPLYFDKILPYAIIFGIESELIEKLNLIMDNNELKLYVFQFKNPFYNILRRNIEYSSPLESWNSSSILGGKSGRGFK